jgi:hypothetical protein
MASCFRSQNIGIVASAALALCLSGCLSGGKMTYGTGVTPGRQTLNDVAGLVSFGGNAKPKIDYAPRAPIVVPPTNATLPQPGTDTLSPTGNWPNDPDEAERARRAALANQKKKPIDDTSVYAPSGVIVPLSAVPPAAHHPGSPNEVYAYDPVKAKERAKLFAEAKANRIGGRDANGNLVRGSLIEPPVVYREPDPTAPTEFVDKKKRRFHWPWQPQ